MCPLLSYFPYMGTWDRRLPIHMTFIIILVLLLLSTVLQIGDSEFSWSGSPLTFVLNHVKVWTRDMGQPLPMTLGLLSRERPSLDPFYIKRPLHIQNLQSLVLAA